MILKNFIIEDNISLLEQYNFLLLYGENDGFKEDMKDKIKEKNKDSEIIILFQEEILNNKNILMDPWGSRLNRSPDPPWRVHIWGDAPPGPIYESPWAACGGHGADVFI